MVEIIVSVVIQVAKCLAPSIERQFSYVRDYTSNFENLKTQVEKLEGEIMSMEHAVNDAERKCEEIEQNVQNWLASANKAIVEAKKFVGDEATENKHSFKGFCPNLKMRRRLRKEAVRQLDAIVKLREDGRFERISHSIIPEDTLLMSNKGYEDFESRISTLNDILGALRNPDISMLGICGMGGIGKTMLAKEVARKAKNNKLFDLVVFSEMKKSRCVVNEDGFSKKFLSGALEEEEAWSLFKKMAGDYVEGSELKCVARDVAKECVGLPVSIVAVARALRSASIFKWKDALKQLRRPSSTNFKHIQPEAYKATALSYDKLEGEELKNLFLLIGYAYVESIDELLRYGVGLGLFQGISKLDEARDRVSTLVYKLKASCMLLDEGLPMHDVIRDVAISIVSAEKNVFTATGELFDGCMEWSDENAVKLYTSIVLRDIKTNVLPDRVLPECPQLKLFSVRADHQESSSLTIPNNFFEKMIQVRVINLTYMNLLPLPSSLGLLSNLRTLSLCYCKLLDISVTGELKKLEILCLRGSDIQQLPVELGQLTWLKLLDLRDCSKLEVIPPNILSNLSHLEDLNIGDNSFDKWDVEVDGVKNASLDELKHLTSLELQIRDVNGLPRGLFFEKLERYRILIGDSWNWKYNIWSRDFRIELNSKISLKDGLSVQLQGIEHLGLYGLQEQDVHNFVNEPVKVGSSQLKHLWIEGCDDALNPAELKLFPNLEELRADAKHIATNNSLFPEDLICKLKCLEAEFGAESPTIFSLDDFLQRFHAMKVLRIGGGRHAQEAKEKAENGMEVIIREVNKCFDLKHFLKQGSAIMDNLEQLNISECSHC
ncbi:putative disease resistance protein [Citrus sinensis]|uniref:Disease resistance protein n=1 Tax=Citrus sinensis TaxID=2711 RepID=A0ACB8KIH8_CITSI|nr:putative disease resistance protein [Citrus sinensis]